MSLVIPEAPRALALCIERRWDGSPCPDARRRGWLRLASQGDALVLTAGMPRQAVPRLPPAPPGARVSDLWNYDVVECFLVGRGGEYLEIELGAAGHFLLLAFAAPRRLADSHETFRPALELDARTGSVEMRVPHTLLPEAICALNAFAIIGGEHLAFHPVPGAAPDFHQPAHFPAASLARA